jgi:hypothetical protein
METFQRRFSPSLHRVGGSAAGAAPVPRGPRHCGHQASGPDAAVTPAAIRRTMKSRKIRRIVVSLSFTGGDYRRPR